MAFLIPPESIWVSFIYLCVGFILLIKGADLFINTSLFWAYRLKIPESFIGLTLVAFGTSAPELFTTSQASLMGKYDIAMSNILGSNIFNLLIIIGLSSIVFPTKLNKKYFLWQMRWMVGFGILTLLLCWDLKLKFYEGTILITTYIIFLLLSSKVFTPEEPKSKIEANELTLDQSLSKALITFILGLFGLLLGSKLAVSGGQQLAALMGFSDRFLGLVILALGTSLPEAVASLMASYKGHTDMAFSNVIGSNATNLLCVLGFSGLTTSFVISERIVFLDLVLFILFTSLILVSVSILKFKLNRPLGIFLVFIYLLYGKLFILS